MALHKVMAFAGLVAAAGMIAAAPSRAADVEGAWAIRDLILDVYRCEPYLCGRVAWVQNPQRRGSVCGRVIVWGLTPSGPKTWHDGSILDVNDGNTYNLSATLNPDGTIRARIFSGIPLFGRTEILKKVAYRSRAGWC